MFDLKGDVCWRNRQQQTINARSRKIKYRLLGENNMRISVTRLGNLLDFGQLFKAFGNK